MSNSSAGPRQPASRVLRTLVALVCLSLAAESILHFRRRSSQRAPAETFVKRFALNLRKPEEIGAMKLEPEADLAESVAVNAALPDSAVTVPSGGPSWPVGREEEATAARDLMLDAVSKRPGWAYHRFLLGQLVYQIGGPSRDPAAPKAWESWATPLRLSAAAAPGLDAIWSALGRMYLENWQRLSSSQRSEALGVLRRALQDSRFVSSQFLTLSEAVGPDEAMSLLPENADLLSAAAEALSAHGNLAAAAGVLGRREAAEKLERAKQLSKIEGRFRMRDRGELRAACVEWATEHPVSDLDDPAGRAQAARVLELWPGDRGGPWETDPRADLVRFFLDGRESAVPAETLSRTLDALSDVPDHVAARVKLRAGDVSGAQEIAAHPQDPGAPEWVPYYCDLARLLLRQGLAREARGALDLVPIAAREDCDGLLARRDVARALKDSAELALVTHRLEAIKDSVRAVEAGAEGGTISVCLDPEQRDGQAVALRLMASGPSIVQYGWGTGRSATVFLQGDRVVSLPLTGRSGRRDVSIRTIAGSPVRAAIASAATR